MPLSPIVVQLSKFEQIEILRAEIEAREEELKNVEKHIREILFEIERQRYLQGVHPLFQQITPPQDAGSLDELNAHRNALSEAIQLMSTTLSSLEAETAGQSAPPTRGLQALRAGGTPPSAAPGAARRPRFDSFDDFKSNRQQGS